MNKCYVFIGPSGSGKTTLAHAIFSPQQKIITYTTRPPRKNEKNHLDYHFVSQETFEEMIAHQEFAEWDRYADHYYGSSKQEISTKLAQGDCFTVLTAPGFWHLYEQFGRCIVPVFITVAKEKLYERFVLRGDSPDKIRQRLALFEKDQKELEKLTLIPTLISFENNQTLEIETKNLKQAIHAADHR
ncbi:guanylate kinase [Enterococcus sp. DIV1368b]|uniref:Guanylate kinase n=2 Tax=Enterococcus mundtii TaxID=53346 RepID=A0ABQ0V8Z9_ENTMU|nr:AAA family ATPase [Enterococcus mundtii]GEN17240.1 guanylate kinase [Ligilactobacillus acidipiscis]AUB52659.1 guanylate kinase [Enterococcus mundtii]MDB7087341.1 AAA family ATPase [Enterococcus mundtii]MZZ57441.1 AAA family ATPase [Enterococcus mundtii]MZZ60416.1 AAA family ATPase [Enterococcus mundtii]